MKKTNKLAIILGLFLLPVLLNAQENVNKVVTQNDKGVITFTIPDVSLDTNDIKAITEEMNKKITEIQSQRDGGCTSSDLVYKYKPDHGRNVKVTYKNIFATYIDEYKFELDGRIQNPNPSIYKNIKYASPCGSYDTDLEPYYDEEGDYVDPCEPIPYAPVHYTVTHPGYWAYLYERQNTKESVDLSSIPPFIIIYTYEGNQIEEIAERNRGSKKFNNKDEEFYDFVFRAAGTTYEKQMSGTAIFKNDHTIVTMSSFDPKLKYGQTVANINVTTKDTHFSEEKCGILPKQPQIDGLEENAMLIRIIDMVAM